MNLASYQDLLVRQDSKQEPFECQGGRAFASGPVKVGKQLIVITSCTLAAFMADRQNAPGPLLGMSPA